MENPNTSTLLEGAVKGERKGIRKVERGMKASSSHSIKVFLTPS